MKSSRINSRILEVRLQLGSGEVARNTAVHGALGQNHCKLPRKQSVSQAPKLPNKFSNLSTAFYQS